MKPDFTKPEKYLFECIKCNIADELLVNLSITEIPACGLFTINQIMLNKQETINLHKLLQKITADINTDDVNEKAHDVKEEDVFKSEKWDIILDALDSNKIDIHGGAHSKGKEKLYFTYTIKNTRIEYVITTGQQFGVSYYKLNAINDYTDNVVEFCCCEFNKFLSVLRAYFK